MTMAYREQTAWLTLVAMLIAYTIYFGMVLTGQVGPRLFDILLPFGVIAAIQAVAVITGHIFLAIRNGPDARQADERDRAIARRGSTAGYYILIVGMIVVGVVMPFSDPAPKIVNTALLTIVLAETVRYVLVIASYRRGWHG